MKRFVALDPIARFFRALSGFLLLQLAAFWLDGPWQVLLAVAGLALLVSAAAGVGLWSADDQPSVGRSFRLRRIGIDGLLVVIQVICGSLAFSAVTSRIFVHDVDVVGDAVSETLASAGQGDQARTVTELSRLLPTYQRFERKYSVLFRPYALRHDKRLGDDLGNLRSLLASVEPLVYRGELQAVQSQLRKAQPVLKAMIERNGLLRGKGGSAVV